MTTIAIVPESPSAGGSRFRATSGQHQSVGKTPGEALDAITSQLNDSESSSLAVVLQMRPDRFFTETQEKRLANLMQQWRSARDSGMPFSPVEQAELEQLTAAELAGATQRAASLLNGLQP